MAIVLAVPLATILVSISALHVYWAAGGRWAHDAVVPTTAISPDTTDVRDQPLFRPGPLATIAVAVLLAIAALIALGAAEVVTLPLPRALIRLGIWSLAAALLLRAIGDFRYVGLFKRVRGTRFADLDTWLYTPLCLVLSALASGVAVGSA